MVEKPAEWRRFEPVELEGPVARAATKTGPLIYENPALALREFERLMRENDRLQVECAQLRAQASQSNNEAVRFQEDLDAARAELAKLQEEVASLRAAIQQRAIPLPGPAADAPADPAQTMHRAAAKVVASYLFANPGERHLRLVEDALRSRGISCQDDKSQS